MEPQRMIEGELKRSKGGVNNPEGTNQYTKQEVNDNNINIDQKRTSPVGTSKAATIRRLKKDAPELAEKVTDGELTATPDPGQKDQLIYLTKHYTAKASSEAIDLPTISS